MTTFSQLVDSIKKETRRPDLEVEIARFCNQTVREIHFDSQSNSVLFFADNFRETQLVASVENGQGWDIPNPSTWQKLHTARYDGVCENGHQVYAKATTPGRHLAGLHHYFYQTGGQFAFAGYGGTGSVISLGYYEYPRSLKYQPEATRLVTWDEEETHFVYDASLTTPEDRQQALGRATNWLLTRWSDVIAEGLRAKVYKSRGDTERARTAYSMYMALRQGLWTSEIAQVQEVT